MLVVRWVAASVLLVAAVALAFSAQAQAHRGAAIGVDGAPPGGPMAMFAGSPERVGRAVDRLLDGLNASEAQRSRIKEIATAAAADLKPLRDAARSLHEQGLQLLAAPTIDSAAAEALRQQMSTQHDQASQRSLQAMLAIANVLTPQQRAQLGERVKERRALMQDRMQRMHQERAGQAQPPATPK